MLTLTTLLLALTLVLLIWRTTPWNPFPVSMHVDPPTTDFTPDQIASAHQLRTTLRWISLTPWVITLVLTIFAGIKSQQLFERLVPSTWSVTAQTFYVVALITLAMTVVRLPFALTSLQVSKRAGLATTTWSTWILDLLKNFTISVALTGAALSALGWAARTWTHWWAPTAVAAAVLTVVISFLVPVLFEPIFNKFHVMPEGALRTSLLKLAEEDGVNVSDVLVADASRRTTALNAYVSGFGSTRRIVVYDTMLKQAPAEEVQSVVAHELGHAKENDVFFGTALGAVATALGVMLLALILGSRVGQPQYVLAVMATIAVLSFFQQPLASLVSRQIEMRADVHALNLTRDAVTYAEMQKRLALVNRSDLLTPRWIYLYFGTHPATMERISFARHYARVHGLPVAGPMAGQ